MLVDMFVEGCWWVGLLLETGRKRGVRNVIREVVADSVHQYERMMLAMIRVGPMVLLVILGCRKLGAHSYVFGCAWSAIRQPSGNAQQG